MSSSPPDVAAALRALAPELALPAELDPRDAALVSELRDAACYLALAPPPILPPPAAWDRLVRAAARPPRARRRVSTEHAMLAVASAGVLAAAAAIVLALRASDERDHWRARAADSARAAAVDREALRAALARLATADEALATAEAALAPVRSPALTVASFGGRGGNARVLLDPSRRRWLVVAFELPARDDRDYQLWLVPDGGAPVSAGLLRRRTDGVLELSGALPDVAGRSRPAISLEPRGGSLQPTSIQLVGDAL